MTGIKNLTDMFLGNNAEESLIDRIKRVTAENKSRLKHESEERIRIAVEKDTPKYLIYCLSEIAKAVKLGEYKVTTRKYWPNNHSLDYYETIDVGNEVIKNIIKALQEKGFEAYETSDTEPECSYGKGIYITWVR